MRNGLRLESSEDPENVANVVDGHVAISVSEERASYNSTFECTIRLTEKQVQQLMMWLNGVG